MAGSPCKIGNTCVRRNARLLPDQPVVQEANNRHYGRGQFEGAGMSRTGDRASPVEILRFPRVRVTRVDATCGRRESRRRAGHSSTSPHRGETG